MKRNKQHVFFVFIGDVGCVLPRIGFEPGESGTMNPVVARWITVFCFFSMSKHIYSPRFIWLSAD